MGDSGSQISRSQDSLVSKAATSPNLLAALSRSAEIGVALTKTSEMAPVRAASPVTIHTAESRIASNLVASTVIGITAIASPGTSEPHRPMQTASAAARLSPALRPRSGVKPTARPPMPKNTYRFHKYMSRANAEAERQPRTLREMEDEEHGITGVRFVDDPMMDTMGPLSEVAQQRIRLDSEKAPSLEFLSDSDEEDDRLVSGVEEPLDLWIEVIGDDGFIFYHNVRSERSTWDAPVGFVPLPGGPLRPESVAIPPSSLSRLNMLSSAGSPSDSATETDEEDTDAYGPAVFPDIALSFQRHFSQKNIIVHRKIERVVDPHESGSRNNDLPRPQGVLEDEPSATEAETASNPSSGGGVESEDLTSSIISNSTNMTDSFGSESLNSSNKLYFVEEVVDVGSPIQAEPIRDIRIPKPKGYIPLDQYLAQQSNSGPLSASPPPAQAYAPPLSSSLNNLSADPNYENLKRFEVGFIGFPGQVLKPGRRLLREGDLTKSPRKLTGRWKQHAVFLFSDILVIAMRTGLNRYKVKLAVPLMECAPKIPGRRGASSFDIFTPIEKVCLMAKAIDEAATWHQAIVEATNALPR